MADGNDKISNHGDNISNLGGNPSQHSDDNQSKKSKEDDLHTRSHAASTFINTSRQNWIATATARCNVLIGDLNEQYESAQELAEDQGLPSKKATIAKTELKDLELIKEEFCKTNSNLIEVVSSAKENPIEYEVSRMRFMTTYRKTRNIFLSMEPIPDESSVPSSKSSNLKNLKLPKVEIPIFDGTFNNWTSFKNLFTSLVHNNNELDNEAKHHFLQTKVSGDAATMIVNLPTEEDNYEKAWSILLKHYDDPFRQIDAHFNALWNCQSSNKGSPTLKEQMVLFRQHTAGLQAIFRKNKIDGFSQSMQYWFLKKCDKGTHAEWQRELSRNKSFRSLDEFYDFMDNRSAAYQRTSANNDTSANGSKTAVKRNHHGVAVVGAAATKSKYCVFCKSRQHYIPACPDYRNLSALDRFKFAKRSKLCFSCFRSDCRPSRCARQVCRKCQGAHNTLLHISPEEWATSAPPRQPNSTPAQQQAESTTPNQRSTEGHSQK
ncbi:uncharacterized protein LOC135834058 [Planococcus citri]|uniref:uncharacterized protein LOC135834058 n=1 Tax=Planococcus citri TaxID=170843 RepID=UPI0031F8F9E2